MLSVEAAEPLRAASENIQAVSPEMESRVQIELSASNANLSVLAEKGSQGFSNPDESIYIPLATAQFRAMGNDRVRRSPGGEPHAHRVAAVRVAAG